jgi:peptidoglycan/LPS O-acetylase OafA/YrhL
LKKIRIPSLDGFRAISIILVLFAHGRFSVGFPKQFSGIAQYGAVGVTIFFVISGFLITTLLLNEEVETGYINRKDFYIRRAFRILPVFLLYILLIALWRSVEDIHISNVNILRALTFTVNFYPNWGPWFTSHIWSLSVEEQFYLIWPTIFILFRKHLKTVLCLFIMYSCIIRPISNRIPDYNIFTLAPYFIVSDSIMIGALGAIILFENPGLIDRKMFSSRILKLVAIGTIVLFVYCIYNKKLSIISTPFGNTFISVSILFLLLSYIKPSGSLVYKLLNNKIVVHVGILSYSMYIWQQFFIRGPNHYIWRVFPYNMIVIYIVSLASYYLWERQFLRLRKFLVTKNKEKALAR